ncbi:hypothetical protein MNBD_GAMMA20-485 [hydrothermal vent metagenome]|uniref:DUF1043 family protein n=1 Tax=hydrothermal vent metagenome TaxID=652676 RepID=A0A3B1AN99_9ZZZZ
MFGEITLLMVLQGAALIAAGAAAGYFLALKGFDKQRDKLNDELENARTEIKEQREKVDKHFLKTALLFNRLTDNYREIYEHLATGAQTLCSPQTNKPKLDQPETRVLPAIEATSTAENECESESEPTATHSPHPDTAATAPTKAEDGEKPTAEAAAETPMSEEATPPKAKTEAPQADATKTSADDKSSTDTPVGADATPAPTGISEEKPATETSTATSTATTSDEEKPASETPTPSETGANVDRHKSPPSIH